jgi:hypothetical protein
MSFTTTTKVTYPDGTVQETRETYMMGVRKKGDARQKKKSPG